MNLPTQLKNARKKAKLSQSQAAKAWGVPLSTLQGWEQGKNSPRGLALQKLQEILEKIEKE